jgi:transposase, IS5 family
MWTKKYGKSHDGYKLIGKLTVSTALENDTRHLEDVLETTNTSRDLYGDKGYVDGDRETRVKSGWRVQILRKGVRGKLLSVCQTRRNSPIANSRVRVEHVFARIEQMGDKMLRCIGLGRAMLLLNWEVAANNLRRLCTLKTAGVMVF